MNLRWNQTEFKVKKRWYNSWLIKLQGDYAGSVSMLEYQDEHGEWFPIHVETKIVYI